MKTTADRRVLQLHIHVFLLDCLSFLFLFFFSSVYISFYHNCSHFFNMQVINLHGLNKSTFNSEKITAYDFSCSLNNVDPPGVCILVLCAIIWCIQILQVVRAPVDVERSRDINSGTITGRNSYAHLHSIFPVGTLEHSKGCTNSSEERLVYFPEVKTTQQLIMKWET